MVTGKMIFHFWLIFLSSLLQEGQSQNLSALTKDGCAIDVAILVDRSGSIIDDRHHELFKSYEQDQEILKNWYSVTNFTASLIQTLRTPSISSRLAHASLIMFANQVITEFDFEENSTEAMLAKVDRLATQIPNGNTNLFGALRAARLEVFTQNGVTDRANVQDVIVVITDGEPSEQFGGYFPVLDQAKNLKSRDIIVLAVGVTENVNTTLLREMVSNPRTDYFNVSDFQALQLQLGNIIENTCTIRPVDDFSVSCNVDLALVIDSSGSVLDISDVPVDINGNPSALRENNWDQVISFIRRVAGSYVWNATNDEERPRVALVTYSDTPQINFDLDQFSDLPDITQRVSDIAFLGGETDTSLALEIVFNEVFSIRGGDRPEVPNAVVLVTDGAINTDGQRLQTAVRNLQSTGVRFVIVYANTFGPPDPEIISFANDPKTSLYTINEFNQLNDIYKNVTLQTCDQVPIDCQDSADIYFVLDSSGSIGEENFRFLKDFVAFLVQDLQAVGGKINVGMLLFGTDIEPQFELSSDQSTANITRAVKNMPFLRGTTNTALAIQYLRETGFGSNSGARTGVPKIAVVITDGNSNNQGSTLQEAFLAKSSGIRFITVGIGGWTNEFELQGIASYPYANNYIPLPNFISLNNEFRIRLKSLLCQDRNECSDSPCECGGTCSVDIGIYYCTCPAPCAGANCQRTCSISQDLIFAVDTSGSVDERELREQLNFVTEVSRQLIVNSAVQIGLLQYNTVPTVQFHLNSFGNAADTLNGIMLSYTVGGRTNTYAALELLRREMFTPRRGLRTGVARRLVLITDGRSTNQTRTWEEARKLRDDVGVEVIVIGISRRVSVQELQAIAGQDAAVLQTESFYSLMDLVGTTFNLLCDDGDCDGQCENGGTASSRLGQCQCSCLPQFSGLFCERSCSSQYDIILAIDLSGSIRPERFPGVIDFIVSFVQFFQVSPDLARFGAIVFSDTARIEFHLNSFQSSQDVISALRSIRFRGGQTNIADALDQIANNMLLTENGDRFDVQNHIVLFTDGISNIKMGDTIPVAIKLKSSTAKISILGIGDDANTLELRGIASEPVSEMLVLAESFRDIIQNEQRKQELLSSLLATTCNDVNECESDPCTNGGTCVDDLLTFYCDCPSPWTGRFCERRCTNSMDVAFALDFSGSLDEVFNIVIAFTREVVYGLPMAFGQSQVSVVTYEDLPTLSFVLEEYDTKRNVLNALSFSKHGGGKTNTQGALQMIFDEVFRSSAGDRSAVPNIVLALTDGKSNVQKERTAQAAGMLQNSGVAVYAAAFGDSPNYSEINDIVSDPDVSFTVRVASEADVQAAANNLLDRLCL